MDYLIKVSVDTDRLLQTYADSQGIPIEEVTEDIESVLESEINGWLDVSGVYVQEIKEVQE